MNCINETKTNFLMKIKCNNTNKIIIVFLMMASLISLFIFRDVLKDFPYLIADVDLKDPIQFMLSPIILGGIVVLFLLTILAFFVVNFVIFILTTLISLYFKLGLYSFNIDDKFNNSLLTKIELFKVSLFILVISQIFYFFIAPGGYFFLITLLNSVNIISNVLLISFTQFLVYKYVHNKPEKAKTNKLKRLLILIASPFLIYVVVTLVYNILYWSGFVV